MQDLVYVRNNGDIIRVPKGKETDLTSLPCWLPIPHLKEGRWTPASVLHDFLYDTAYYGVNEEARRYSDEIYREAMECLDISSFMRNSFYFFLRAFGWISWYRKRRNELKQRR